MVFKSGQSGYTNNQMNKSIENEALIEDATLAATRTGNLLSPLLKRKDEGAQTGLGTNLVEGYVEQNLGDPNRVSAATTDTVDTNPNYTELSAKSEEANSLAPIVDELTKTGIFTEETNAVNQDPIFVAEKMAEDIASQQNRASTLTRATLDAPTGEDMKATIPNAQGTKSEFDSVRNKGTRLTREFNDRLKPVLMATDAGSLKIGDFLVKNELWNAQEETVIDTVGTSMSVAFLKTAQDIYNKTDTALDTESLLMDSQDGSTDPALFHEQVVDTMLDDMFPNPNVSSVDPNMRTEYGGASKNVDPEIKSILNALAYETLKTNGMFNIIDLNKNDPTTTLKEERLILSPEGEAFYLSNKRILDDIQPDKRINVSYVPSLAGQQLPGRELEYGNKARNISKRSKADSNVIFEDAVKMRLGSMPLKINTEALKYAQIMVNKEIMPNPNPNGMSEFVLASPSPDGRIFSTGAWAKTLSLDEDKYTEFYVDALKRFETREDADAQATDQANKIMRQRIKHVMRTMGDASENNGKVFYNKYFHASSVGRYFIRNTVLNSQNEKLVRSMVRSAKTTLINVKVTPNEEQNRIMDNWTYIIGKNLLDPDPSNNQNLTNNVKTEDMGWDAILRTTKSIIKDPSNEAYSVWYTKGQQLRAAMNESNPQLAAQLFDKATSGLHESAFKKKDDWGYKMQSYIDFANYVDAKTKPDSNGIFELKAMVQHDGKQNGMQLGDYNSLTLTGLQFTDEKNIIPQGDLRAKFLTSAISDLGATFATDQPRQEFWSTFLAGIANEKDPNVKSSIIKDLSKVPMMETSYGMPPKYHIETAKAFLNTEAGKRLLAAAKAANADIADSLNDIRITADLNSIIGSGLKAVINIEQQMLYKKAGQMYAMMGGDVVLKGPLGTNIYMGANEHFQTGTIQVPNETDDGFIQIPLTQSRYSGSGAKRYRGKFFNKDTQLFEREGRSVYGKLASNQLPVLTVQQIDAAILANTIYNVNKDRKRNDPLFMIPVHDALITDATSVDKYHREVNNQFLEVNKKYSILKSIYEGMEEQKNNLKEMGERFPGNRYTVSYDTDYRALHDYLFGLTVLKEEVTESVNSAGVITEVKQGLNKRQSSILSKAMNSGWSPEGGDMTLAGIYDVIDAYDSMMRISAKLKDKFKDIEAAKAKIYKLLKAKPYPYN
jgi:hypothetical protein